MLKRLHHSVSKTYIFGTKKNGILSVLLRHNRDCSKEWGDINIFCFLHKKGDFSDSEQIQKFHFTDYKTFRIFRNILINGSDKRKSQSQKV